MKRMVWVVILSVAVLTAGQAYAMSIGTNAGVTVFTPKGGGDNLTTVGVPAGGGLFGLGFMPGLRLGSSNANGNDFYADLGIASAFASGSNITAFQGALNFQHAFSSDAGTSPFVTVGVGMLLLGGDLTTSSNATVGGGFGVRSHVSQGHGVMRAEVRFDYVTEDSAGLVGGTVIGFKLGFDLIMK